MFDWPAPAVGSPCVMRSLPFYLVDNVGAKWNIILHQRVGELEQIRDVHLLSLHFRLLFPHGEVGWHLAVQYQGKATNHNNDSFMS